jgi:hypothetical protein
MSHQNLHNIFNNFPEWALFMYEKAFEIMDRNRILLIQIAVESKLLGSILLDANRE